jgi:hypothetical protein
MHHLMSSPTLSGGSFHGRVPGVPRHGAGVWRRFSRRTTTSEAHRFCWSLHQMTLRAAIGPEDMTANVADLAPAAAAVEQVKGLRRRLPT